MPAYMGETAGRMPWLLQLNEACRQGDLGLTQHLLRLYPMQGRVGHSTLHVLEGRVSSPAPAALVAPAR
eukprot:1154574-Pelagomonas_calceolata.AAC.3